MILGLLDEAVTAGARLWRACEVIGLSLRTVQRWKRQSIGDDRRAGPRTSPRNALSRQERADLLALLGSPEFRDKSPNQIVPLLADRRRYVASEATMYRILREANQLKHRAASAAPSKSRRPIPKRADGPGQVWSWDITYLRSEMKGRFHYLYLLLDVWSRAIVGFAVHDEELGEHSARLVSEAARIHGVVGADLVLHSDNGAPMKCATMLAKLQHLGIAASFSRPSVSNDNPFSESLFRTAKYRPEFPQRPFASLEAARAWAAGFVAWYNDEHLHSAISFVTPNDRHDGRDIEILERRRAVYHDARRRNPARWSGQPRRWTRDDVVVLNPQPTEEAAIPA